MNTSLGVFITSQSTRDLLIEGAALSLIPIAIALLLSRYTREVYARTVLAATLTLVTLGYVAFALDAEGASETFGNVVMTEPGPGWLGVELLGMVVFSAMAWAGVAGSRWWLAAAWALHPLVWDVLHWVGPGASFAPSAISIPCITFDLLVAGYVALSGLPAIRKAS